MITIAMIDNIAKRITAETTPIWRYDLNRITRKLREPDVLFGCGYARLSSSTGMVRILAVWRAYSAKPG